MHRAACSLVVFCLLGASCIGFAQATGQNRSHAFAPGTCGPVDPSYIRTAEATGGIPFFFHRTEVGQATKFMMASGGSNRVTVLWAKGELQNNSRDFVVPIDSTLTTAVFVLSTDNHDTKLAVLDATGNSIAAAPNADTTDFTCGRYIILKKPISGEYRVHISGSGHYWFSTVGNSEIFLHGVEFVERGGRLGHEGMFPIHGQPLAGHPAHLQANVSGSTDHVAFGLIGPGGESLQPVNLQMMSSDPDTQEFAGTLPLPSEPFRFIVTGTDENGHRFQRVHEALFTPASISLVLTAASDLLAGRTATFSFQLRNSGNTDKFKLLAVCTNGWATHVDPAEAVVARGGGTTLKVTVAVPEKTAAYTGADLVLTAAGQADAAASNNFVQRLSVEPPAN